MANDTSNRRNDQQGHTLVELLVAITLGLILTAAVVQSYMATRQTSRITEGVSRVQENARFGLHFLTTDIRDAGYSGCIGRIRNKLNGDPSNFLSFKSPIQGWEYTGTATGDSGDNAFELSGIPLHLPSESAAWGQASGGSSANLPTSLVGRVVAGSDVLYFKSFAELDLTIKNHKDSSTPIVVQSPHGLENKSILLVGNCSEAELFQHLSNGEGEQLSVTASEGNGHNDPGNRHTGSTNSWSRDYDFNDTFFGFKQTYFYIGQGSSGLPSLFRFSSGLPLSAVTREFVSANLEELVEGVETMQLLYGEDVTGNDNPNRYVSAHQVSDWDAIVSVRVGLLMMSPKAATDQDQSKTLGTAYTLLDGIEFTHAVDDLTLRYALNRTIKLRNRGLDNNLAYSICDAVDESEGEANNGIDTCATDSVGGGSMGGGNSNGN